MIELIVGTFILDFQTIDFEPDSKAAVELMTEMQKICKIENAYALDPPVQRAGWSFAKLFMSGEFVEKVYAVHASGTDVSKGKKFEDKFITWLQKELKDRGCGAQIKMAPEMKEI